MLMSTKESNKDMVTTQSKNAHAEPVKTQKRIGSTLYMVNIHFSETSRETMEDKILRLIGNEAQNGKAVM